MGLLDGGRARRPRRLRAAGSFNTQATLHDFAFAVVGPGGKSGTAQLDTTVGSFPITFSGDFSGQKLYAFGYPAAGKYHGNDLVYCAGNVFTDEFNGDDVGHGLRDDRRLVRQAVVVRLQRDHR